MPLIIPLALIFLICEGCLTGPGEIFRTTIRTTVRAEGAQLKGTVKTCNTGNTTAYDLRTTITLPGEEIQTLPRTRRLEVNECTTMHFEKGLSGLVKGTYPVRIIIDFTGSRNQPFSALSCATFSYKQAKEATLRCKADASILVERGRILFRLKNTKADAKHVRATLMLPREFFSPRPRRHFQIGPLEQLQLAFEMINLAAPWDAAYPVFCFFEYDHQGAHQTVLAKALVKIEKGERPFGRVGGFLLAVGTVFALILTLLASKRK
jgi:hypothetical protein